MGDTKDHITEPRRLDEARSVTLMKEVGRVQCLVRQAGGVQYAGLIIQFPDGSDVVVETGSEDEGDVPRVAEALTALVELAALASKEN